ncbi:DUF4221 domain-containing protein [Algoriphagus halophytocola]|uniref:DUF4221 domain-containing protein n=1 Tax=Algoriphagus halophytocola TaxID=2991499 RepID=A0ABY6MI71_9BACT|nr:DUF4221 domain-containing protein [Algoriphagus sp. TR-M5]UZD22679.1 DUF4221 domain-containing protein [Algoriphagus sp. TR-M5]
MRFYILGFWVILNITFTSCTNKKDKELQELHAETDSIIFQLNKSSSNSPGIYFRSYKNSLVLYNRNTNSLDFYSRSKGLEMRVNLPSDGPYRIQRFTGFDILKERIFVADQMSLLEMDFNGNVVNKYSKLQDSEGLAVTPNFAGVNKSILIDGKLIFTGFNFLDLGRGSFDEVPLLYSLDLASGELTRYLNYPDDLPIVSSDYYFSQNTIVQNDRVLLNYAPNQVYGYKEEWQEFEARSLSYTPVSEFRGDIKLNADSKEHLKTNSIYRALISDPYRNCYYRIYSTPFDPNGINNRKITHLLVLNSNLELEKEFILPKGLSHFGYFLNEVGLYFVNSNYNELHEDEMKYTKVYPLD